MTVSDNKVENRKIPEITESTFEDAPFSDDNADDLRVGTVSSGEREDLRSEMDLKDQKHKHEMDNKKLVIAKWFILACIVAAVAIALIDFFLSGKFGDSDLMSGAFDLFRLVTMAAIGYVFGASGK